jgi:hypothetical protein
MQPDTLAGFHRLSLEKAIAAFQAGQISQPAEWLARVPAEMRLSDLAGAVHYALARLAVSEQRWSQATSEMARAVSAALVNGHYQQRLALLRRRQPLMADMAWQTMAADFASGDAIDDLVGAGLLQPEA